MDLGLAGRRAIVTGGSRGIGRAIARSLAAEGVAVVVAARGADALAVTARELAAETGGTVVAIPVDTGSDASVDELVRRTVDELGGVDILVNNAARPGGAGARGGAHELTTAEVADDFNVKVLGYLRTAQAVRPHFAAQHWGRIVNIGGLAARQVGLASGSIRNVGVAALAKTLSDEWGRDGITVNVVHPGLTLTDAHGGTFTLSAERLEAASRGISIGRPITADEVAAVVTFLASPLSVAITGESIAAGGGSRGPIHY